jgi:hypothetical protein
MESRNWILDIWGAFQKRSLDQMETKHSTVDVLFSEVDFNSSHVQDDRSVCLQCPSRFERSKQFSSQALNLHSSFLQKPESPCIQNESDEVDDVEKLKAEIQMILAAIDEGERRFEVLRNISTGESPSSQRLIDDIHNLRMKALISWVQLSSHDNASGLT